MLITKRVKLCTDNELDTKLREVSERQTRCANFYIEKIREKESTKLKDLSPFYQEAKKTFNLSSDMTQIALFEAIRMVRRLKDVRKLSPNFKHSLLILRRVLVKEDHLSLPLGDRKFRSINYFSEELLPNEKLGESRIVEVKGEWYLYAHINVKENSHKRYKRFMGVDLGVAKTAVVADWNGNNTKFFRGEPYRFKKKHYQELRKNLAPKVKQGNVYKLLKRIKNKEARWVINENHKISREIVNIAIENKRSIALEKLTGITERLKVNRKTRKMLKGWSFRQLADFIEYKAKLAGITVVYVDPRNTSKTCPKCQYCSRSNRRTQSVFRCRKCNYESNADRVGAMNIAIRANTALSAEPI